MEAFFFGLSFLILIINILISNENIKNREALTKFVKSAKTYENAFNAMREVTNNQAELLESILSGKLPLLNPSPQGQQRAKATRKSRKIGSDTPTDSP